MLSHPDQPPAELGTGGNVALFSDPRMTKVTLEQAELVLAKQRELLARREEKVAACESVLEGYLASMAMVQRGTHASVKDFAAKAAAERAAADSHRLAIRGIERFISWRKANPLLGQRAA